jgi:hypothetical protein
MVIIRCLKTDFGNYCTSVNEYNSKFYPLLCAHVLYICSVGRFLSCDVCSHYPTVTNINFEAPDDEHISQNMQCSSDLKFKMNFKILTQVACETVK